MSADTNYAEFTYNWTRFSNVFVPPEAGVVSSEKNAEYKAVGAFKIGWFAAVWKAIK